MGGRGQPKEISEAIGEAFSSAAYSGGRSGKASQSLLKQPLCVDGAKTKETEGAIMHKFTERIFFKEYILYYII